MPVEIAEVGDVPREDVARAISVANALQEDFEYIHISYSDSQELRQHAYRRVNVSDFLDMMESYRKRVRGYHPFMIAFVDSFLDGKKLSNLFGSRREESGLAVVTICNVSDIIVPGDKMVAYVLYYIARYTLSFVYPTRKVHTENRQCVFDAKVDKRVLLESMSDRPFCDDCRRALLSADSLLSPSQLTSLTSLIAESGRLLRVESEPKKSRPAAFIGSSSEGLEIARKLQELLRDDLDSVVWDQGTTFGLGDATLESLEQAVLQYDFGLFVFTPDDELHTRGQVKNVARDNVIFELGLFAGKLTRHRALVVHPRGEAIALPSDLKGITTATYDANVQNLAAALGPACQPIREAVKRYLQGNNA